MTNPDLINQANAAAEDIKRATTKLNSSDNSLGKGLNAFSKPITPMTDPIDKFQSISQGLQNGQGSAGKFLNDPAFQATAKSTWENASSLMDDVNAGKGGIGELAKDPTLGKSLSDTLAKAHALLSGIDAGKGSAGKFMNDKTTTVDLKALQTESNDLVAKIRKDPKKYLTIQFRLF
jgi:phospholipid/cholesterol/gamma-HCH transport system substrate-binding protein